MAMCKLDVRSFLIEMNLRLKHCLSMAEDHQHAQEWTVTAGPASESVLASHCRWGQLG